jgi:hypothetical protein
MLKNHFYWKFLPRPSARSWSDSPAPALSFRGSGPAQPRNLIGQKIPWQPARDCKKENEIDQALTIIFLLAAVLIPLVWQYVETIPSTWSLHQSEGNHAADGYDRICCSFADSHCFANALRGD